MKSLTKRKERAILKWYIKLLRTTERPQCYYKMGDGNRRCAIGLLSPDKWEETIAVLRGLRMRSPRVRRSVMDMNDRYRLTFKQIARCLEGYARTDGLL